MKTINLKTGTLQVSEGKGLDELVSFGSRINKKRGFFFISKVTGKHLPVRPSKIEEIHSKIAKLIPHSNEVTLFIGLAEAAVALGQGVFEKYNNKSSFFIHTTRYKTSNAILLKFQEEHSHAPSHILYKPLHPILSKQIKKVTRIIIIDDEVSTGNTVNNFIIELKKVFPNVNDYQLYSILDWSTEQFDNFSCSSLYKGNFSFVKNNEKIKDNITSTSLSMKNLDEIIPYNFGRYGSNIVKFDASTLVDYNLFIGKKVLVLGSSEFTFLPYKLALYLENMGILTYYQSTTRSPINQDRDIVSILNFYDNYTESIDNFLYNVIDKDYDNIIICYETVLNSPLYDLKEQLKVKFEVSEIFFKDSDVVYNFEV